MTAETLYFLCIHRVCDLTEAHAHALAVMIWGGWQ